MPKISVCIPTFNRAHFLPQAIASVQAQTESDWELWVCDDGSIDETAAIMARYVQDDRIRYIRHPHNVGKSNNMRSGYTAATGQYFIKFDDDDRLTPEFLARTAAVLDRSPEIDLVGTDHWIINAEGIRDPVLTEENTQKWGRKSLEIGPVGDFLSCVFVSQSFQVGATLFRRSALQTVDFMRTDWQNCEDNDLFVRLALAGKQAYYLSDRVMEYRVHPEQQGIDRALPYLRDKLQYLHAYQFENPDLEQVRTRRLAETQLLLGLRLVQAGEIAQGRTLIQAGSAHSRAKSAVGVALSYLPTQLRSMGFEWAQRLSH